MAKFRALGQGFISWCARHKIFTAIVVAALILVVPAHSVFAIGFKDFVQNPLDATALILAGIIQNITAACGLMTLRLIELIVIPVLGYNGFYNSNITNLGWSLVRDVVNMFVVVVLLVIAIMTILGISKANWAQQLPRLFIAIVLVNFSKLICGFLIDVSQVIMFTFVNAIVSIAAGNFASMWGLSTFGQFGSDFLDKQNKSGDGAQSFMFLGAAYFQFVIYLAILGVMFLLAIAFIWRIVILWILIIMSPLAFFMIGIKDIFPKANSSYSEWWGKFGSALMFGPMMTFFLWLALAASAGSTLSQTEDFPMPEESNSLDLPLEMFSLDNFLGMFLALAILIAGMQQASSSAKGMEGFASSMLSAEKGKGLATWLAKSPFKAAGGFKKERAWVNERAQKGAAAAAVAVPGLTKGAGNAMSWSGRQLSRMPGLGGTGNALAAVGGNVVKGVKETRKAEIKKGGEQFKERTDEQIKMLDAAAASQSNAFTSLPKDEKDAYLKSFGTDQKRRDKYKKNLIASGMSEADAQKKHNDLFKISKAYLDNEGKDAMDDAEKDRFQDAKFANLHLLSDADRRDVWDTQEKEGRLTSGLATISVDAFQDSDTSSFLRNQTVRQENGKDVKAWDDIVFNGKGSQSQKRAIEKSIKSSNVAAYAAAPMGPAGDAARKAAGADLSVLVKSGRLDTLNPANPDDAVMFDAIRANLSDMGAAGHISNEDEGAARGALLASAVAFGSSADKVFDTVASGTWSSMNHRNANTKITASGKEASILNGVQGAMDSGAVNAELFKNAIPADIDIPNLATDPVVANQITKRVASVDAADIKKMRNDSTIDNTRKREAMATIDRAVSAQKHFEDNKIAQAQQAEETARLAELTATGLEGAALLAKKSADDEVQAATAAQVAAGGAGMSRAVDARLAAANAAIAAANTRAAAATVALAATAVATVSARARLERTTKSSTEEIRRLNSLHKEIKNPVARRYEAV